MYEDKKAKVDYLYDKLCYAFNDNLNSQKNKTTNLIQVFNHQTNLFLTNQKNQLKVIDHTMNMEIKRKLQINQEKYRFLISKLNTLSPLKTLERGYAIVLKNEQVVASSNSLSSGDEIEIKMKDGSKKAVIK